MLLGAFAVLALGCPATNGIADGGSDVPDSGEPDAGDGCTSLTLGARDFHTNIFGQLTGVSYPVSPGFDGPTPENLLIELYDSTTPGLQPLHTGTITLGVAPEDSLDTCQYCVWVPVDQDPATTLTRIFIATEGSLTLTQVEDPLSPVFTGSTSGVLLREATIDETGVTTLVPGGRCAHVPDFTFDTSLTPGKDCISAEDCGNAMLEVCSPASNTCTEPECGDFLGCPEHHPVCLTQYGDLFSGGCYELCNPLNDPSDCAEGESCIQLGPDPTMGVCKKDGTGALGDSCNVEDNSTSCAPGMLCSNSEHTCTPTCNVFFPEPGCQAGHACNVLGVCEPESTGDPAQFGEPCADTATMAQGCNEEGGAFRGICFAFDPSQPTVCQEACLGNRGCEFGEFCAPRFSSGLGICLPNPVCGDGALGEINEVCDDGNTLSGDGCSSDCKTVEYGPICGAAPLLTNGDVTGDTSTAWDGFQATCQFGIARAEVYHFTPPSRGRLSLTVDSPTGQAISVRSDCADAASELSCGTTNFSGSGELIQQVTDTTDLTVLISATTVLEQGPFTLHTEFVPEQCGDGIVAGLEVCDDGNTVSNDGCSNDCSTIEYGVYCSNATMLTSSVGGDNTGGPEIYTASCANNVFGSGPDRLFTYTAPSAGTAHFKLEPDPNSSADLVLAVFDSCGAPTSMTELGCSSVYDIEQLDVPVTAGQTVTVLVEGFNTHSLGAFTLSAQLMP